MSKTVFILGAGASISHSKGKFPSYNDFFTKARTLNLINDKILNDIDLLDYIYRIMKVNILSDKSQVDIEKLMTFMDIEIENTSNRESYKIQLFKERLLEIIIKLFENLSKDLKSKNEDYNNFIKKIKDNDTVITFNWDVLLDKIFIGKSQYSNLISLIEKDRSPVILDEPTNSNILSEKSYYLKLHGSADWKYCPNKDCDAHNKIFISMENLCATCFKSLNTLIIPPIINKQFKTYPFIEKLWELARIQLDIAQEIVIWGYRLPPTDFYSNWLLSKTSSNVKKVSIVNPDCILSGKRRNVRNIKNFLQPFYDIYGEKKIALYKDYQDYLKGKRIK
ncbi:MAG: hypothetical protein MUO21_00565 [Nitrososphaeraceae archaeon]|nr:hypothetical protein [Nitrososphaeraceae archaeon]